MNAKNFAHHTQRRLEETTGLGFKRSHIYELVAAALGAGSYAALGADGLLCQLPSPQFQARFARLNYQNVEMRARALEYPQGSASLIASQVCEAIQQSGVGVIPLDLVVALLLGGVCELHGDAEDSDEDLDVFDDESWCARLEGSDPESLNLGSSWIVDALHTGAARGDGRAHLALAQLLELDRMDDDSEDEGSSLDGRYWYERQQSGEVLTGVEKEWADIFESRGQRQLSTRQHLEKAAELGQHDALLLLAARYGDERFFELSNPQVHADPLWVADVADKLGRYEVAPLWLEAAAKAGNLEAMRDLIEQRQYDDPVKCWTWYYLAKLHGTDLTEADYRAIGEDGASYDDDVGGPMFIDGRDGVTLPEASDAVREAAKELAEKLFSASHDSRQ